MEHTDEKQNGEQQPSVEKVEYCVDDNLVCEDEILFYKLITKNEEAKIKFFLVKVDNIVLSPGLCVLFSGDILEGSVLDICKFDEYTYSRLVEKNGSECIYKSNTFELLLPPEVNELNKKFSGTVVSNPDFTVFLNNEYSFYSRNYLNAYEVKLDNNINVKSIDRIFKNIYIFSKDLLNGYSISGFKIDPISLFNENNNTDFSKPVLYSHCYDKKDILSNDDLWLIKRLRFNKMFTTVLFNIAGPFILLVLFLNLVTSSEVFAFSWIISIFFSVIIGLVYFSLNEKVDKIKNFELNRKNEINTLLRVSNIFGSVFMFSFILLFLFLFSRHYEYKSEYVYDNENKVYLEDNSFNVPNNLIFGSDKIIKRFIPIYKSKSIDVLYQTPGSLLSFSNKYIDLEIHLTFKKGDYLLGDNLDNSLSVIRDSIQKKVSSGHYGDLSSMNTYDYRKAIINIEEDIMNLVSLAINEEESVVEDIKILTKYAKLHNVEK
jgi:hypothetical protein